MPDPFQATIAAVEDLGRRAADRDQQRTLEMAKEYDRERHLPKLIPVFDVEIEDYSIDGTAHLARRLLDACQSAQKAGETQHWSYRSTGFMRHQALVAAFRAETERLHQLLAEKLPAAAE